MMSSIDVEVDSAQAERMIAILQRRTASSGVRSFLRWTVRPFLLTRIATRFATEGDDASGKWVQLAHNTGLIRARKGYPAYHPINIRTAGMIAHLMTSYRVTGSTLTLPGTLGGATLAKKIATAQIGGGTGKTPAPPRPVLAVNDQDSHFVIRSFQKFLQTGGL